MCLRLRQFLVGPPLDISAEVPQARIWSSAKVRRGV